MTWLETSASAGLARHGILLETGETSPKYTTRISISSGMHTDLLKTSSPLVPEKVNRDGDPAYAAAFRSSRTQASSSRPSSGAQ